MSALFATVVISTALIGQPAAIEPDAIGRGGAEPVVETQALIDRAIADLGSDRFVVRKMASQQLWRMGLAAEPALRKAVTSRDREVRTRAKRILSDFDFGIIPGVPANILVWIHQFREGDPSQRQNAFAQLLSRQRFDMVERLLLLERDANIRRALLVKLFSDSNAIERFIELDRVETLIKTVGADQNEQWRRTMMARVLSAPKMLTRLIETGSLDTLLKFIQKEDDAQVRKQLLLTVLQTPGSVAALIKNNQLDFAFTALMAEEDKAVRGELLLALLAAPEAIAAVLERGKLDQVLAFAKEHSDSMVHKKILEQLFRTRNVVARLLEDPGFDALIAMVSEEQDPHSRGELLANLMMSSDMRKHVTANGKDELFVTLAKNETDLVARRAYLDRLFQYGNILYSIKSQATLHTLWSLVKSDPDRHWRTVAISRMLATSRITQLLDDPKETDWLFKWLVDEEQLKDRGQLLAAMVNNYSLRRKLLELGHFDKLFELVKIEPEAVRGQLLTRLISSSDAAKFFRTKEKTAQLIALATEFTNANARTEFVTGLFRNHWAMTELIKHGHYEALAKLANASEDAVDRAILYGEFVRTRPVIEQLKKRGELDSLIELATQEENKDAQHAFLQRLYRNHVGLGALIDAGHFDKLLELAKKTEQSTRRAALLADFYTASKVVTALIAAKQIDSLITFAKSQKDTNVRRQFLQRLCYNQEAIGALVKNGHFETLLALASAEKHPSIRASLMGAILGSPAVVKHLTSKEQLGSVLKLVTREPDASSREQLLTYVLSRSGTVTALVENGLLPSLLKLVNQSTGSRREQLLGQVLLVPKVLEHLAAQKRLSMVLAVVETSIDGNGRTSYLQRLFYNSAALTLLINHGFFDDLLDLTLRQKEATFRATLLGRLFALDLATQQLVRNNRVDFFLKTIKSEASVDARRNLLTQLVRSKSVVTALIKSKQIDLLMTLCLEDPDDAKRRSLLSELLASPDILSYLAGTHRLKKVLTDVLAETDQAKLRPILERLLTSSESMRLLSKHNLMAPLITLVETGLDDNHRKALLNRLANNQSGAEWLATTGKTDLLIETIGQTTSSRRGYLLRNILYARKALSALLKDGHFDLLLTHISHESNDSTRRSMMATLLFSPASLDYLAGANQLDRLFKSVIEEADDSLRRQCIQAFLYRTEGRALFKHPIVIEELLKLFKLETESNRSSFVRQMMVVSRIRQGVIQAGKADLLREFAAMEKDEVRRKRYLQQLLFAPAGVVSWHIRRGEYERVEEILVEHADDDRGRIRLAMYLSTRNLLDARVDSMQQQLQTEPEKVDQRQLLYLLRAQGDLSAAQELATSLGDDGLLRAILVERQAWGDAAALQAGSECPLPVPIITYSTSAAAHPEIETLGYLATFQRLAGQQAAFAESVKKIQQLQQANPTNLVLAWHCAEALLVNDCVDQALAFLCDTHPRRAFTLYTFQHRYDEALQLIGMPRDAELDRVWFDGLPGTGGNEDAQTLDRFEFALHIMRVFDLLGQTDNRDALLAVLLSVVDEMPKPTKSTPPANAYWELTSQSLFRMGLDQQAWTVGARVVSPRHYSPALLTRVYGRRAVEANAWWRFLRAEQPSESVADTLGRLHRVLYPQPTGAAGEFSGLAKQAEVYAETISNVSRNSYLLGIATTCRRLGETAIAMRCLQAAGSYSTAAMQRADLLAEQSQAMQAARLYEQIWEDDNEQLAALYLSGHAYQQAGRVDEATHHKQLASEMALDSRARHTMASALAERGLLHEAIRQWKFLRVTAPFEHWELNDAARRLALAQPDQPALAAKRWLHYMLGDLRNVYYMLEHEGYLRVPTKVYRFQALAAVEAGDLETAARTINLAAALTPGDTTLAEELTPAFDRASQSGKGDQLFETLFSRYEADCKRFPNSAYLHNNLAWLAARCGRRIDVAFEHATKAVALAPHNGSYLDTLAEVHFCQGDRESAIRYSKRAVQLSPDRDALREQLSRFISDPLP